MHTASTINVPASSSIAASAMKIVVLVFVSFYLLMVYILSLDGTA